MKVVHFVLIYIQFNFVLKIIINKTNNNQRLQSAGDNRLRAFSLFLQIQYGEWTRLRALRDARNEGGSSHAVVHWRVSDVLLDGPRKKRDCSQSKGTMIEGRNAFAQSLHFA